MMRPKWKRARVLVEESPDDSRRGTDAERNEAPDRPRQRFVRLSFSFGLALGGFQLIYLRERDLAFTGVHDELEWIELLILVHELQVGQPLEVAQGFALGESASAPVERVRRQLVLAVGDHALHRFGELTLRNPE